MTILDRIIQEKRSEVDRLKKEMPLAGLKILKGFQRKTLAFQERGLLPGIIAEYKRRSPSRGDFTSAHLMPAAVARAYADAGASAVSILTDSSFFGGSCDDLQEVRAVLPATPILRKDFIIDPYQVYQTKAIGADIILLIASVLSPEEVDRLSGLAVDLGLQVLLELHDETELDRYHPRIRLVGINNRNLKTFDVDLRRSVELLERLPSGLTAVAESGLTGAEEIRKLWAAGFSGFLMGEYFMNSADPGRKLAELMEQL